MVMTTSFLKADQGRSDQRLSLTSVNFFVQPLRFLVELHPQVLQVGLGQPLLHGLPTPNPSV